MKHLLKISACFFSIVIIIFISCKKEFSCEGCKDGNKPPIANAGADQMIILPKDSVTLDGSASTDADGIIKSYKWAKIAGPVSANIIKPDSSKTIVKGLTGGVYEFELTVTDNGGLSAKDTVRVMANGSGNQRPIACAGPDQIITLPADTVTLDGSCSADPDNNITNYTWTKIAGPSATIANANLVKTQATGLLQGAYQFELKVTDAGGLFSTDTIQITVNGAVAYTCGDTNRPHINAQLIPIGTLSQKRSQFSVASAGNKILFAGGSGWSSRVDIYDIAANSWSTAELSKGRDYGIAGVAIDDKVFFAGGEASDGTFPSDIVDIYNSSTNSWTVAHLSLAGEDIAASAVGDKVIFAGGMGGFSGGIARSKVVDIYHLSTNSWTTAALSEYKIRGHNAVTANNKVYISGGYAGSWANGYVSNKIDIYDNATNTWSTATMPEGKSDHAGIVVGNNIYWAGGVVSTTSNAASCSVDIINASTESITRQYLHSPGTWWISAGQNAVIKNNKIIFYSSQSGVNKFDIYEISTNTWSIGVLPIIIKDASIISVNDIIYVAGGTINGVLSNQVWKLEF